MAFIFEDGTDFEVARQHGDVELEYPLIDKGDNTALIIKRTMRVLREFYTPTARGTALAGYTGSRLVRESPLVPVAADVSEFQQIYATVPENRTGELEGSSTFSFPGFQYVAKKIPATAQEADDSNRLWEFIPDGTSNTNPGPVYVDYQYFLESSPPTIPDVFKVTLNGNNVDFVTDGGSGSFAPGRALNGESFTNSYSVSASSPSASDYSADIVAGTLLIVDVKLERYMGDIFVMKTYKMRAQ